MNSFQKGQICRYKDSFVKVTTPGNVRSVVMLLDGDCQPAEVVWVASVPNKKLIKVII